jgi:hypothetical protein
VQQGWTAESRWDDSLVYRHDATGCTLQRVRKAQADGVVQRAVRWLLFTRLYELLGVFEPEHRDESVPFPEAERIIQSIPATEMCEGASPGINLFGTYTVVEALD